MTDDGLRRAAATALKVRFPEPDGVNLVGALHVEPTHPRRRTLLAAAACAAAVVAVTVVAVALSTGGARHPVASAPPPGNSKVVGPLQQTPDCRPGAADVTVRLGGAHLLGNRVPVKARVKPGGVVRVVARFGSRNLTTPASDSQVLQVICSTGGPAVSTFFRAAGAGSATVTSHTTGCDRCMQVEFAAHVAVVASDNGSSSNAQLLKLGLGAARVQAAQPETITAVRSTHARAVRVTMQAEVSGTEPLWVLQVKTTHPFACNTCSRPAGTAAPKGRYIRLVLDASSLRTLDTGITLHPADLSRLGHVITLFSR
jgi:hypothetical protein